MPQFETLVTREDIDQEIALLAARGIQGSRSIIAKKLSREAHQMAPLSEDFDVPEPEPEDDDTHQKLISWAIQQSDDRIMQLITWFLDCPDQARLRRCVQELKRFNLIESPLGAIPDRKKRITYKALLIRMLPATKDELIEQLSATGLPIKRPATTVRQFLRRHSDVLAIDEYKRYHWNGDPEAINEEEG